MPMQRKRNVLVGSRLRLLIIGTGIRKAEVDASRGARSGTRRAGSDRLRSASSLETVGFPGGFEEIKENRRA